MSSKNHLNIYWQEECQEKIPVIINRIYKRFPMLHLVKKGARPLDVKCYDPSRYQYDVAAVLDEIQDTDMALYLVHGDLYYPGYRYLYGAASKGKAVVSDFRPDTLEGLLKEVTHELGHVMDLDHCRGNCVMHMSHSERELEKKSREFCSHCRKLLEKRLGFRK